MIKTIHASDCAINNAPALPVGPCDCGAKQDERTPGLDDLPDALDFLSEINAHSGAWCFMYEGEDGNSWTQGSTAPDQAAASVCSLRDALAKISQFTAVANEANWKDVILYVDQIVHETITALKGVPQPAKPTGIEMTEAQIKHMVDRFLSWKLPESFNPDGGISFEKMFNEHTSYPSKHEPYGTNLFNFDEATAMVHHMLEGLPATEVEKLSTDEVRQ